MEVGSTLRSSSRWLNDGRIRDWMATESLRRNGPDYGLIEGLPTLIPAIDEVRDRDRAEALIKAERRTNSALDNWFEERFVSTYTVADLGTNPLGSLGRLLHDYMIDQGLSLELLTQRQMDPNWAPKSDLDYFTLRTGQTHDFDHLLGEVGFDVIGELFPTGLRTGNMFAHVSPDLAGELLTTNMFITQPWMMRTMLHYPAAWPAVWQNYSHGHDVGMQSDCLFTVKWEDYLHLNPADARAALGVRGFRGPTDNTAASRIFGEGKLII